ncbi:protein slit-like [Limulus polyphemus]|uniref:Protein slit-like n=1 Tax=Limulus polyphemus TaxID=6850 RepID=A0ABM1BMQ4_LIMPO|nr:protein slit-like [Limulus polyphemus]
MAGYLYGVLLLVVGVASYGGPPTSYCPTMEDMYPCKCEGTARVVCNEAKSTEQIIRAFKNFPTIPYPMGIFLMEGTTATNLPSGVFNGVQFHRFDLKNNRFLTSIGEDAFEGSEDIAQVIFLNNGAVSTPSVFKAISKLNDLAAVFLDYNDIPSIPDHAFGDQEYLNVIKLQGNRISSIGQYAFEKLDSVTMIDLRDNQLNKLTDYSFAFRSNNTEKLLTVLLINNSISEISPKAFSGVRRPVDFLFNNNKLTTLDQETFESVVKFFTKIGKGHIVMTGNPIQCDCRLLWIVENSKYWSRIGDTKCQDGRYIQEYKVEELGDCQKQSSFP